MQEISQMEWSTENLTTANLERNNQENWFFQKGLTKGVYARSQSNQFDNDNDNDCPSLESHACDNGDSTDSDEKNHPDYDYVSFVNKTNKDKLEELNFDWDLALDTGGTFASVRKKEYCDKCRRIRRPNAHVHQC